MFSSNVVRGPIIHSSTRQPVNVDLFAIDFCFWNVMGGEKGVRAIPVCLRGNF